jgi:hypothetical protein
VRSWTRRGGCLDSVGDLSDGRFLQDVAAGAGQKRIHDVALIGSHGQHQDKDERGAGREALSRPDPGHPGHVQIHQHHVGMQLASLPNGIGRQGRFADDADSPLLEEVGNADSKQLLIVHDDDGRMVAARRIAARLYGNVTSTSTPPRVDRCVTSRPPSVAAAGAHRLQSMSAARSKLRLRHTRARHR